MPDSSQLSSALDSMFQRAEGLYGSFDDIPVISQKGHYRRIELLEKLEVGDVTLMTCVDFGMGSWGFAACYPRIHRCARAIGLDVSPAAIELSRKLINDSKPPYWSSYELIQSDGMDIPLADGSIDLFYGGESIEHVAFPPRFICEIYRVLKPNGQLVLTTPNRDALHYKNAGEEYCTSPEHFWLFNHQELVDAVSEYFDIKEIYGFNGTFGPETDRAMTDPKEADVWSREFLANPELASGIVLRAVKKPNIEHRYEIFDVAKSEIQIEGSDRYLDLEFGLKGLYLGHADAQVTITRPPSDGIVVRFWCHRWSGLARISTPLGEEQLDLYTFNPGWKHWLHDAESVTSSKICVSPLMKKNPKSVDTQILFFDAFCWKVNGVRARAKSEFAPARAGYGFSRFQPFVTTTVFHWFTKNEGNVRGPWQPVGGRATWDGSIAFWKDQIHGMMMANIDAIYLHCIDQFEQVRIEFFRAYAEMRADGWDVPKISPFLDPFYLWRTSPIDVATSDGKHEFARHYIRFYEQYFSANTDPEAYSFLLTVDGKLALSTWWVYGLLRNLEALSRDDLDSRLRSRFDTKIPQLNTGTYMISTSLVDPDLSFTDERVVMFSGFAYGIHSVHQGLDVWHVQAGYWDQNIRSPGYFLPRDGGKNYRRAWDAVVDNIASVHRVYVESWNEYDEGSGIYAADPSGAFVDEGMQKNSDTFSDCGDPNEYLRTTARGASLINRRPMLSAQFLDYQPKKVKAGSSFELEIQVRNTGNKSWATVDGFGMMIAGGGILNGRGVIMHDGGNPEIVRGQPIKFRLQVEASKARETLTLTASLFQQGLVFCPPAILTIGVY